MKNSYKILKGIVCLLAVFAAMFIVLEVQAGQPAIYLLTCQSNNIPTNTLVTVSSPASGALVTNTAYAGQIVDTLLSPNIVVYAAGTCGETTTARADLIGSPDAVNWYKVNQSISFPVGATTPVGSVSNFTSAYRYVAIGSVTNLGTTVSVLTNFTLRIQVGK